ncbi:hypothetical protein POTOM_025378 [Populus tomentosa]|uniref:Myb/SANT-like DNA-binding domain-containing protein n=1 Tax=Populus tomentosa TaxID=118781 RepID=A0A8X8CXB6_POPTO|nr:hypothetical protein POTOM_025378 [Populus tomentosa]
MCQLQSLSSWCFEQSSLVVFVPSFSSPGATGLMEHNDLGGGIFPGMGSGMLGLELPLHQQQNPQNPHHLQHPQIVAYAHHESDQHQHSQQSAKHAYTFASTKPKQLLSPLSNEDEPSFTGDDGTTDGKRKISPWQRMKWTDNMVRLLIMAVFYIGDEVGSEVSDPIGKKKPGGLAQKKGKWKSVSRAMMEKGFYVSPQQCEDKFNDLNKRYKRVNDILGKGTACRVVENQSLLDTMDLSPKMKDEVRKLLNSKHLFFREMCAYHNSCGHAPSGVASGINNSPETATDPSHAQHQQATQQQQQQQYQRCSHSTENAQQLNGEIMNVLRDGAKSSWEKNQWMKLKLMQLEEQQVNYHCQAFELEKQRLKWVRFSSKKEREMERAKLENERRRLENERMVLIVRKKELELLDTTHQQQQLPSNKRSDPSPIAG